MRYENNYGRIEVIDVIRGFALLGIALIHFDEQFYLGVLPDLPAGTERKSIADIIVLTIITTFVQGKFYMIFSFLFGLSFFIQLNKSDRSNRFVLRFGWRLVVLFIIGLFHQLLFAGDILTKYAVLGFVLLLLQRLPDKILLAVALLLVTNIPCFALRLYNGITEQSLGFFPEVPLQNYFDTMKSGDYISIIKANWTQMQPKLEFQFNSGRIFVTTGLFLLGLWAGRHEYFKHWQVHLQTMRLLLRSSLWVVLACIVAATIVFGSVILLKIEVRQQVLMAVGGLLIDISNACMMTIYITGICLLYQTVRWQRILYVFCAPGRMGLTTYVTQAIFGLLVYSAIGFGLLGEYGTAANASIGIAVFIIQVYLSKWWLSKFNYGPFEWIWRIATNKITPGNATYSMITSQK